MDMLNQFQRFVQGDDASEVDALLREEVQAAYPVQKAPTSPDLLFDRLMAHAEALPQLPSLETDEILVAAYDTEACVQTNEHGSWWGRFFRSRRLEHAPEAQFQHTQRLSQELQFEVYREYLENNLRQVRTGVGLNPM
jgi:hypothetical protein